MVKVYNGKEVSKTKKFKKEGMHLLKLESKIKGLGVPTFWKDIKNNNQLIYPHHRSLKQQIQSTVSFQNGPEKICQIYPKKAYYDLFDNEN